MPETRSSRIESELEVRAYLQNLFYALDNGAKLSFQVERKIDQKRDRRYTNKYTISDLFPDENPVDAIKHELKQLTIENYIQTVSDIRFKNRSEMREFGRNYSGKGDVYIKIRVELLSDHGNHSVFVMSFHYAEKQFIPGMFPYRKERSN